MTQHCIFLLLSSIFLLVGCNSSHHQQKMGDHNEMSDTISLQPTIIAGKIKNTDIYPNIDLVRLTISGFREDKKAYTSEIAEDGSFKFTIYPKVKREIKLYPIEDVMIVKPTDSIYIEKDFADIANSTFTGSGADLNQAISQFRGEYLGRYATDYQQSNSEFRRYCEQKRAEYYDRLSNFVETNSTPDEFVDWANKQIELDYYKALFLYPTQHYFRTKQVLKDSTEYFSFLDDMNQVIDKSIVLADYYSVAEGYLNYHLFNLENVLNDDNDFFQKTDTITDWFVDEVFSSTENDFLAQLIISSYYNTYLYINEKDLPNYTNSEIGADIKAHIDKNIESSFLNSVLSEHYSRVSEYNQNPKHFSDAILSNNSIETTAGILLETDDDNIVKGFINKHKGSVIFIDFWAPWCSPCIRGMNHAKKMIKHYESEDVVFAFFCINSREDTWRKRVEELNIGGTHLYCDDETTIAIKQRFGFTGIPFYMLINKEGVIVDYGNHLTPRGKQFQAEIDKLLNQ